MSDEARQCPVTPQELRLFAKHVLGGNYWPPRILELADWLEKPAPAFSSRCPQCSHAVHVGKCLRALRVGKPGEDVFCLCKAASEPTRAAEFRCTRCNGLAEWRTDEKVWRHAGEPHQEGYLEQGFCGRYGYPIEVSPVGKDSLPTQSVSPTAQARRQFRVGGKVPTHIYDDARPRDVEHFFGEVAACHRPEDAAYLVELTAQARPRATKEQVQNLMMRMGGTYQQAVEALNDELGIEVSE